MEHTNEEINKIKSIIYYEIINRYSFPWLVACLCYLLFTQDTVNNGGLSDIRPSCKGDTGQCLFWKLRIFIDTL